MAVLRFASSLITANAPVRASFHARRLLGRPEADGCGDDRLGGGCPAL